MGLYDSVILPCLLNAACGTKPIARQREKVVPYARGHVVEIGIGSGLNLSHYDAGSVDRVTGIDPDEALWAKAATRAARCDFPVERLGLSGESLPLDDCCADTVLVTYALCTIPDPVAALREMGRILKPDGEILFCEHGRAPDPSVARWQDRIDPVWKRIAGGCHSGRDIPALFTQAGLHLARLQQMYIPGPKPLSYNYWGAATRGT
ncbi:class I SAM-dependent methyltransferase [Algimonas porphyrae]|uniref:Phospholipid methyltransferase n=1 Tax=Algimonas porphyrae TaxID=1128113 RepID=A0ABQ5UYZ6_9PROT|nr:class I SAM-dependent methyltransferase [Algimonas porphyrae]GLQ20431.1 phospholipid methyltransferase [Algimonas porphyrae]